MKIIICHDERGVGIKAAQMLLEAWPSIKVLCLPTGGTPEGLYGWLVQFYYDGLISFKDKWVLNLDEYFELPPNHPQSYRYYMHDKLFRFVDVDPQKTIVPAGLMLDSERWIQEFEDKIKEVGGIDYVLLGIGVEGHIAFNEKGSAKDSRTRIVKLAESTREANKRYFDNKIENVPTHAVSMGIETIMEAHNIILLAKGSNKAEAVAKSALGPMTAEVPASWLQEHENCTWIIDRKAGAVLLKATPSGGVIASESGLEHEVK